MMTETIFQILNILIPVLLGVAVLWRNKGRRPLYSLLGGFFIYTGISEWMGLALLSRFNNEVNIFFYENFNIPIGYVLQFLLFYIALPAIRYKRIVLAIAGIYLLSFAADKLVVHYLPTELSMISYCIGSVGVMLTSLLYLYDMIQGKRILYFRTDLFFWIACGSLFFQLFTFVFYALMRFWDFHTNIGYIYHVISMACLYISYLFYANGTRWMTKK